LRSVTKRRFPQWDLPPYLTRPALLRHLSNSPPRSRYHRHLRSFLSTRHARRTINGRSSPVVRAGYPCPCGSIVAMSLQDSQLTTGQTQRNDATRRAVLLTSYRTGATRGKNLGVPGYSYDLVADLFVPLLARWGEVIPVAREADPLETAVHDARRRG